SKLLKRLELPETITSYSVRGIFLSNIELDANGASFLDMTPTVQFIGPAQISKEYISDTRSKLIANQSSFDVLGYDVSTYTVDAKTKSILAPVKAEELVRLDGISDQSIFDANLRGHLGNTKVNKDIVESIKDQTKHKLFPLFHNGITIITEELSVDEGRSKLTVKGYGVVNGCQSMKSLFNHRKDLSADLRILTRFIQVDKTSDLLGMITSYSNNQNGIKARDFKSNHDIQIRLQNEFKKYYSDEYFLEIKRGEDPNGKIVITNEVAGLLLLAFDLKEPWTTHQKYKVFDDKYTALFARPEVDADRIVALSVFMEEIGRSLQNIDDKLLARYALTRYLMLYMIREILEKDIIGVKLINNPAPFVRDSKFRKALGLCIQGILSDMVVDINAELKDIKEKEADFDYKSKLKSPEWSKNFSKAIVNSYEKLVQRERLESFEKEWTKRTTELESTRKS
ncbi:MAG: AIPR family protein, partial [Deltaproteobacteria bacterium]